MFKQISYSLINLLIPGFSFSLLGNLWLGILYPVLISIFIILCSYLGYLFKPESFITIMTLVFIIAMTSSLHILLWLHFKKEIYQTKKIKFSKILTLILWLIIITSLLFFRQAFLGLELYSIHGDSMLPTLKPDDIVMVEVISPTVRIQENDVLVFYAPKSNKVLIKRYIPIKKNDINEQSSLFLLGDNLTTSLDSRLLGAIPRDRIIGKVHWVLLSDGVLIFKNLI